MAERFQHTYRVPSARAQWWDYGHNAAYFVTICTKNREHFFGKIVDGKMQLSSVGIIADVFWHEIKTHVDFVTLDSFVVMPNHIHGIVIIDKSMNNAIVETGHALSHIAETDNIVKTEGVAETKDTVKIDGIIETGHALSLQPSTTPQPSEFLQSFGQKRFRNQGSGTLSAIIGSYKSAVTKHTHRLGYNFVWQTRFHDHIIRNNDEYRRIADYIIRNPESWKNDKFFG